MGSDPPETFLPDQDPVSKRKCSEADPVDDLIDWLVHADIADDMIDEESPAIPSEDRGVMRVLPAPPRGGLGVNGSVGPGMKGCGGDGAAAWPQALGGCLQADVDGEPRSHPIDNEEYEWDSRQKKTGAAGRLVIYDAADRPREDVLLRGGSGRRIMVTAVQEGGKAAQAGVKAGDVLVSVNGKKDFSGKSADMVQASLRAPVMLVFMGFVGKLQAEVRLNYKEKVCGISSQQQLLPCRPDALVQVIDEVVFKPGDATLFLTTSSTNAVSSNSDLAKLDGTPAGSPPMPVFSSAEATTPNSEFSANRVEDANGIQYSPLTRESTAELGGASIPAVYELRGCEARRIVSSALSQSACRSTRPLDASGFLTNRSMSAVDSADDLSSSPREMTAPLSPHLRVHKYQHGGNQPAACAQNDDGPDPSLSEGPTVVASALAFQDRGMKHWASTTQMGSKPLKLAGDQSSCDEPE